MAYITVTNSGQQVFGFDSNQANNISISMVPENLKVTVQTLEAGLKLAQTMATALGVDTSTTDTGTTGSGTSSSSDPSTAG